MNILQVCSAENLGGGERHVIDLTEGLIRRGHHLHLAVRPRSPLRAALAGLPVTFHELPLRNALDFASVRQLSRIVRAERIDILHAHVGRDYIVCGLVARLNPPLRLFLTRHHFNRIRSNAFYRWAVSSARALIAVSETVRSRLVDAFPHLGDHILVIPNWLPSASDQKPVPRDDARRRLSVTHPLAVAIIGQISPLKGQDIFIAAAIELLKSDLTKTEFSPEFLIVGAPGPDDQSFATRLIEQVERSGFNDRIRFTGFVEDIVHNLAAFDIVTLLSENEAFSLVLVEAMAAGCAVVATRVGGMAEIVEDGETGIFTDRDQRSLTAAISRLATNPALRRELARHASHDVRQRFDRERIIDRLEELYLTSASK